MKNALVIHFFDSFASGTLYVALPLMMKARGVDVVVMGFVFAAMPLVMQLGRMFFAVVSDFLGRKPFFVASGVFGFISSLIYYAAHTTFEFLYGKVIEGIKDGALWAVNRPFLLEKSDDRWRILVYLRAVVYAAYAVGSLLAGFLIVWLFFEGTMLLCAVFEIGVVLFGLLLVSDRKVKFNVVKALGFLDFRKKSRVFKAFMFLFFISGVSYGFIGGFVIPVFLSAHRFNMEAIGLIVGMQLLLSGLSSYLFSRTKRVRELILCAGVLFSVTFLLLGFSGAALASALIIFYGFINGLNVIGMEGILPKISNEESYGTDIGLVMMGHNLGYTISLAASGLLITTWGFVALFLLAASTYTVFYVGSYIILK